MIMAKTDLDFIGSTVKFIGGQASFTGDVISISEGEKAKKEAEFTTEAEKHQYYKDQGRYILSILSTILDCFKRTQSISKKINIAVALSATEKAFILVQADLSNPDRYDGSFSKATWLQINEAMVEGNPP